MVVLPIDTRPHWAYVSALVSGVLGLAAGALQIAFYVLTYPTFDDPVWGWTGSVAAVLAVGQFLALIPVAYALLPRVPAGRLVNITTLLVIAAAATVPGLQLALMAGWLPSQVEVWMLLGFLVVPLYSWLLVVNSLAHRRTALPRPVTRLGLFVALSGPAGLLLLIAGLLVGEGLGGQLELGGPGALLLVPGAVLGTAGWLLLPVWTLLLGTLVLGPRARRRQPPPPTPSSTRNSMPSPQPPSLSSTAAATAGDRKPVVNPSPGGATS